MSLRAVRHTAELDRVNALPRRKVTLADAEAWAEALSPSFRKHDGVSLLPWQAYALAEIGEAPPGRGAFLGLPVGAGKTLVEELAPIVTGAIRPIMILPPRNAGLRQKTYTERTAYSKDWVLGNPPPRILTAEELALETKAFELDVIKPDLILLEECHGFSNPDSSVVKRIDRYVTANEHVRVVAMSGTISRGQLMRFWHVLCWCLRDGAPVPQEQGEAAEWAAVLDYRKPGRQTVMAPGALGASEKAARRWFSERLSQTPGVVIVDGDSCKAPIHVSTLLAKEDQVIDEHFERFLLEDENPFGLPITDPLSRWRLDTQLNSGIALYWDPPPPEPWLVARKECARFVRQEILRTANTRRPLDTEKQVLSANKEDARVLTWLEIKPTFKPITKCKWLSDSALESVEEWLASSNVPGIVWVGSPDFGDKLAHRTGLSYYRSQGTDRNGKSLVEATEGKSIIVSWVANKAGFNLQAWPRMLICQMPESSEHIEQIAGRAHRHGQTKAVEVTVLVASGGTLDAISKVFGEARTTKETVRMTQKILRAKVSLTSPQITESNKYRWASQQKGKENGSI